MYAMRTYRRRPRSFRTFCHAFYILRRHSVLIIYLFIYHASIFVGVSVYVGLFMLI